MGPYNRLLAVEDDQWDLHAPDVCTVSQTKTGNKMFGWAAPKVGRSHMTTFIKACLAAPVDEPEISLSIIGDKYMRVKEEAITSQAMPYIRVPLGNVSLGIKIKLDN